MRLPDPTVRIFFGLEYSSGLYFTLDDPVRGVLDNATYLLATDDGSGVDVETDAYTISIRRGRSRELDEFQAGTCTVSLWNFDRTYDALNAASIYYGDLVPGKRIQIIVNGSIIYAGVIEDWNLEWGVDGTATATLTAVDALGQLAMKEFDEWTTTGGQLAGARIQDLLNRAEVSFGSNISLSTGQSTLQADLVTWGSNVLNYAQLVAQSDAGRLYASRENVLTFRDRYSMVGAAVVATFADGWVPAHVTFPNVAGNYLQLPLVPPVDASFDVRFELVRPPNPASGQYRWSDNPFYIWSAPTVLSWSFLTQAVTFPSATVTWAILEAAGLPLPGQAMQVRMTWNPATDTADCYWRAAVRPLDDSTGWTLATSFTAAGQQFQNNVVTTWSLAGLASGQTMLGDVRRWWLQLNGVLVADVNAATDLPANLNASSFTATTGQTVTVNRSGSPGTQLVRGGSSAAIAGIRFHGIRTEVGSELLFNRVGVDRETGTLQTVEDVASEAAYGVRNLSLSGLLMDSDSQSLSMAEYLLYIYKDPTPRIAELAVKVSDDINVSALDAATVTGLEIGDLVRVVWTPAGVGAPVDQTLVVEGVNHDIGVDEHIVTLEVAPSTQTGVFILDDPVWGVLDTGPGVLSF